MKLVQDAHFVFYAWLHQYHPRKKHQYLYYSIQSLTPVSETDPLHPLWLSVDHLGPPPPHDTDMLTYDGNVVYWNTDFVQVLVKWIVMDVPEMTQILSTKAIDVARYKQALISAIGFLWD